MSLPTLLGSPGTSGTIQTTIGTINVTANQNLAQVNAHTVLEAANGQQVTALADSTGANKAFVDARGSQQVSTMPSAGWSIKSDAGVGAQSTATQASAGAGNKNVMTGFEITGYADDTGGTPSIALINIRDGATGAGTILWQVKVFLPTTATTLGTVLAVGGLWIEGSAATAMTIEQSAASGAHAGCSINANGVITAI